MAIKWQSTRIYEHPAKHQTGTCGQIAQHDSGVYVLRVGGAQISCPQDWAAKIHKDETANDTLSIRIPGDLLALIDQQAKTESRTRSNMIVTALKKYFTT